MFALRRSASAAVAAAASTTSSSSSSSVAALLHTSSSLLQAPARASAASAASSDAAADASDAPPCPPPGRASSSASILPFARTRPSLEAREAIAEAQFRVWGTVRGNNLRSGRKRLRQALQGPSSKAWYGYRVQELLPEWVTPIRETYFRAEEGLQRLGKSRVAGRQLQPRKITADEIKIEDLIPDVSGRGARARAGGKRERRSKESPV
jgi:hypothetical protein